MPFHTHMFTICSGSLTEARPNQRSVSGHTPPAALPSLGRKRIRPCTLAACTRRMKDFHTHNLLAEPGEAIINLPREWLLHPELFLPREGALYSAGIHPWWTADKASTALMADHLPHLLAHPQVVAVGECGLDALQGTSLDEQEAVLLFQLQLAEEMHLPVTLHIVRTFDRLLHICKLRSHHTTWTVHGFRGKPALARQLLDAGLNLSYGKKRNEASYLMTPPERRFEETDDEF